jgi:hypothetical protein
LDEAECIVASNWPIVPAPVEDGPVWSIDVAITGMRKPKNSERNLSQYYFDHHIYHSPCLCGEKLVTYHQSYGPAMNMFIYNMKINIFMWY